MSVKELLEKYNLTQQELAGFMGIPRGRISMWVSQNKDTPPGANDAALFQLTAKTFANLPSDKVKTYAKTNRIFLNNVVSVAEYEQLSNNNIVQEEAHIYETNPKNKNHINTQGVDNQWLDLPLTKTELNNMLSRIFNQLDQTNANMNKLVTAVDKFGDAAKDMAATNLSLSVTIERLVPLIEGGSRLKTGQVGS